jgi:hypothetical protein
MRRSVFSSGEARIFGAERGDIFGAEKRRFLERTDTILERRSICFVRTGVAAGLAAATRIFFWSGKLRLYADFQRRSIARCAREGELHLYYVINHSSKPFALFLTGFDRAQQSTLRIWNGQGHDGFPPMD